MSDAESKTSRIRALNDQLRSSFVGGQVLMTRGIDALDERLRAEIIAAVMEYDGFDEDNDPHHEHDFAMVQVQSLKIIFKIDYYDLRMKFMSPDPSDPAVTRRVLTIMLLSDY